MKYQVTNTDTDEFLMIAPADVIGIVFNMHNEGVLRMIIDCLNNGQSLLCVPRSVLKSITINITVRPLES